ncbi:hypothetical protein ABMA27_012905 [Loxostege sticticalis]|uniref:Uncharacterized protein n=1 Tax=Loxostege sticticalis TaxID=481309 RepID=A0ABR3H088_LOXSC
MNYSKLKKLDEETLEKITEGKGPSDKCLCSILAPPDNDKKGIKASIKRAFASFGGKQGGRKNKTLYGQNSVDIPLSFTQGGKGIYTTKEAVKRKSSCGKCGCDSENLVLKHSFANIRITSPDVSSICPCPSDCLPEKDKLQNNIKVTVEHVYAIDSASDISDISEETYVSETSRHAASLPVLPKKSAESVTTRVWSKSHEKRD